MAYASKDFHATVTKWEAIFNEFHKDAKDGLLRIFDVTKKLTAVIESKFPDFEEKHIKCQINFKIANKALATASWGFRFLATQNLLFI